VQQAMHEVGTNGIAGRGARAEAGDSDGPGVVVARTELIGLGSGDENVVALQLAARWAEKYGPEQDDSLDEALRRLRRAYNYINAVIKLVDPEEA
jgi:hypothetical protein